MKNVNNSAIFAALGALGGALLLAGLGGCGSHDDEADIGVGAVGKPGIVAPAPGMPGSMPVKPVASAPIAPGAFEPGHPGMPPLGKMPSAPVVDPNAPVGGAPVGGAPLGAAPAPGAPARP